MVQVPPLGRWGTPVRPVSLSQSGRDFLEAALGPGGALPPAGAVGPAALPSEELPERHRDGLAAIVGKRAVAVGGADRRHHAMGSSLLDYLSVRTSRPTDLPGAVVRPGDAEQVRQVLRYCAENRIPVVPFGGGTSVVGGVTMPAGSPGWISLALDRLDRVLAVDEVSQTATVQPGVTGPVLERVLRRRGFTWGHLPQSWERATVGGYVATRSAGQASSGYGRSDEMVESLQVATAAGLFRAGRGAKNAAGPDLRHLFIGSEGALGVVTEATLRISRLPTVRRYEAVFLPDWSRGSHALRDLVQLRSAADVMRLSDPHETEATLAMSGPRGAGRAALDRYLRMRGTAGGCMAVLGWEGYSGPQVAARRRSAWRTLRRHGAVSLGRSAGSSWVRHRFDGPYLRDELLDAGYLVETVETAGSWRQLPVLYRTVAAALRDSLAEGGARPYVMCHISHVYTTGASLYFTALVAAGSDPARQWSAAKRAATDAMVRAGGTITHHHAVGRDHAPWLAEEIGAQGIRILRAVKAETDPAGVLNPGVLVPSDQPSEPTGSEPTGSDTTRSEPPG